MSEREILFRGKRVDNGEWVYGLLCRVGDTYANIAEKSTEVMCTVLTNTIGQCTGVTDKNGTRVFEGDIVRYYHHKKSLVPVTDIKSEENHHSMDEESGLPLAYRTTKIIRYKGHVELDPILGMTINLKNRCEWWRNLNYEDDSINSDRFVNGLCTNWARNVTPE